MHVRLIPAVVRVLCSGQSGPEHPQRGQACWTLPGLGGWLGVGDILPRPGHPRKQANPVGIIHQHAMPRVH